MTAQTALKERRQQASQCLESSPTARLQFPSPEAFWQALVLYHARFVKGDISFGKLAEQFGVSAFDLNTLLTMFDMSVTNL